MLEISPHLPHPTHFPLGYGNPFHALGGSGMLWDALGCSGMLWDALGCLKMIQNVPKRFGVLLGYLKILWDA